MLIFKYNHKKYPQNNSKFIVLVLINIFENSLESKDLS
jgi:hypothetical protein